MNHNIIQVNDPTQLNLPQNNTPDFRYFITEAQVYAFIQNFKEIYNEEDLKEYHQGNKKEIEKMQADHGEKGSSMWGIVGAGAVGGLIGYGLGSYNNHSAQHTNYPNQSNYPNSYPQTNPNNTQYQKASDDVDDYDGDAAEGDW